MVKKGFFINNGGGVVEECRERELLFNWILFILLCLLKVVWCKVVFFVRLDIFILLRRGIKVLVYFIVLLVVVMCKGVC